MGEILNSRDEDRARIYIERGDELRRDFDSRISKLLHSDEPAVTSVPKALLYRFLKRVTAHSSNVVPAIIYAWWGSQTMVTDNGIETTAKTPFDFVIILISIIITIALIVKGKRIMDELERNIEIVFSTQK